LHPYIILRLILAMHTNYPDFMEENYNVEKKQTSFFSWTSFLSWTFFFISLVFLGFLTYAIFKYNTDDVRDACPNLLTFINIRTVIGLIFLSSLFTYTFCVHHGDPEHLDRVTYNSTLIIGFLFVYFLAFCIAGILIVPKNMIGNAKCQDAIQDSALKAPLLGILGWIFLVCDGLFAIYMIYILSSIFCCSSESHQSEESERMLRGDNRT
jgi:hypothetical protein